jgi:hypothetical protein
MRSKLDYIDSNTYILLEESEGIKRVIRIRVSKKNRQHNGRKKKDNRTNNDLQNIAHTIKDRVTQTW